MNNEPEGKAQFKSKPSEKAGSKRGFKNKPEPPKLKETESVEEKLARLENEMSVGAELSAPLSSAPEVRPVAAPAPTSPNKSQKPAMSRKWNMTAFWLIVFFSIFCANVPILNLLLYPVTQFVTMVHEMGHALAAILTGGHVSWMTIVSDGQGHGGITGTNGGWPLLVLPAGYLFTTFFGCFLIWLGQYPRLSKAVLAGLGVAIMLGTLLFMLPTLVTLDPGRFIQGIFSIIWGLALGSACIYMGKKFNQAMANLAVLFLAVQTALNSLGLLWVLVPHSLGLAGGGFSDATLMSQIIPLPPILWVFAWVTISLTALFLTLRHTYGSAFLKAPKLNARKLEE